MASNVFTERKVAPYRFDVVGSFLRPEELKKARAEFEAGSISKEELTKVEDKCIAELVEKQKQAGLHSVTDGEFRRSYWHTDFFWGFEGVERTKMGHGYFFHGEETRDDTARVCGKISHKQHPFIEHFKYVKSIAGDTPVRQTIPAPAQFYAELVREDNAQYIEKYYESTEELVFDIAAAYHDVILKLYEAGCRNVQLDDCTWGMFCDESFAAYLESTGGSLQELQDLYLRMNNDAIAGLPEDLVITTHVCRGNYHSTWACSGGYEKVAPTLFGGENVSAFYLEFDNERSGGFEPLRYVKADKQVVLGLVTSKDGTLEDKETVKARIKQAANIVPLDQLCLSPQCGFASTEEGNVLTEQQQWDKIKLIKELAEEVWG